MRRTDQLRTFEELFGEGPVTVTEEMCLQHASVFDWDWAARNLLSPRQRKAYKAATAPAREARDAATASAQETHDATLASALKAYKIAFASAQEALASAWEAYRASVASAQEDRDPAIARAREAYRASVASAREAYRATAASAWARCYQACATNLHEATCTAKPCAKSVEGQTS